MNEKKINFMREIKNLHKRNELSKAVGTDYYEPGMMEYLEYSDGYFDEKTGRFEISFEVKGTRYEGRTEQIEKVKIGDELRIVRDMENHHNANNFRVYTLKKKDLGNLPATLCNAIAPLYDQGDLSFDEAKISYVEPISVRSRYAKQAILFVAVTGNIGE